MQRNITNSKKNITTIYPTLNNQDFLSENIVQTYSFNESGWL